MLVVLEHNMGTWVLTDHLDKFGQDMQSKCKHVVGMHDSVYNWSQYTLLSYITHVAIDD